MVAVDARPETAPATATKVDRVGASRLPRNAAWQRLVTSANPEGVDEFYGAREIPLALIDPNPHQPRKGPLRNIPQLAASIEANGQLQPIVVNPPVNGRYTLIAGARRKAAFEWLGEHGEKPEKWLKIVAVEKDTAANRRLVEALTENLSREALTGPEIIAGLSILRDLDQLNQTEMAKQLGVSEAWISQAFSVAGDPELSVHVQTETLSVAKAYEIVTAGNARARDAALRAALGGAPRRLVRFVAKNGLDGADSATRDAAAGETDGTAARAQQSSSGPPRANGHQQDDDASRTTGTTGATAGTRPAAGSWGSRVATATVDAGVRDLADLAGAYKVTGRWSDLQLARLIQDALLNEAKEFDAAAFLKLARRDIRHVEALVRAAAAGDTL